MRSVRVSIASLMAIILFVSVGLASLRNPTILWASVLFTLSVALFCSAVLAALASRGQTRVTWAGLAVFGWAYLGIAFVVGSQGNGVTPPPFPTQALADYLRDAQSRTWAIQADSRPAGEKIIEPPPTFGIGGGITPGLMGGMPAKPTTGPRIDWMNQRRIVHSLGAVAFAVVGALIGRILAARNDASG